MDKYQKLIYDLLQEVREDQKEDSAKIAETAICVSDMKPRLERVENKTDINTKNLGEHMSRTDIAEESIGMLKDLYEDNQKRIAALEDDNKKKIAKEEAKSWLKKNLKYWLTIATIVAALASKIAGLW